MDKGIAIKVSNVSKTFKLPHEKQSSIKGMFVSMFNGKRTYEKQRVLKDISFEIKKGEFLGIVGRNGSGKSTLLKLLAGIYTPDKGHIQINGKLTPFIELGVGFNPELTGRENVFLNGALLGFNREEMAAMYDEIVKFAELEKFMDQKLKNYSSGMQVRLAFSIAIRANTDILVLDEVLAVGDEAFQRKCYEYFISLKRKGKTVVLVTHSMDAVRSFCTKAILINDGQLVVEDRNVDKVSDQYSKLFLPPQTEGNDTASTDKDTKKDRFGTGDIKFSNISHDYTKETLRIKFSVNNKTSQTKEGIHLGINFYNDNTVVTGNGTKYIDGYKRGLKLKARETKLMQVEIPNNFGNFSFDVYMGIRGTDGTIYDEIKPAFQFQSNNTQMVKFFKVTTPLTIKEL